ncbi:hypothetical protein [Haloprofundus salinisoli]|uniref:hypothetical protein n=1 Tax=Haloprofundus salinisoli TaxID=2876193 RepID=UPI001CCEA608|nr:hypothetical protein [Haloprofundus salinisoli]
MRTLLYLAEGMIIGPGITVLLLSTLGAFFIDVKTGSFNPTLSAFGAFTLLIVLFFLLRGAVFYSRGRRYSRDDPPEYQDWKETRRWIWVGAVAIAISGLLFGASMFLWGWWAVVFLQEARIFMLTTIMGGFLLHLYVLNHIGVEIL